MKMKLKHSKIYDTKIPILEKEIKVSYSVHHKKLGKGEQMNPKVRGWEIKKMRGEMNKIENRKHRENQ